MSLAALRAARLQDAALLERLQDGAFARPWRAAAIAQIIGADGGFALIVDHEERPAGFALARVAGEHCDLLVLVVAAPARGLGLGAALLEAACGEAAMRGAGAVLLEVASDNELARALYRSRGFEEIGVRRNYYAAAEGRGRDACVMRRAL